MELVPSVRLLDMLRQVAEGADHVPDSVRRCLSFSGSSQPGPTLSLEDVLWMRSRQHTETAEPLHHLLTGCQFQLPTPAEPPRDPELEARCQRLRREQEERQYRLMTKNVDNMRLKAPSVNMGKQMREINAQLVEVGQVVFSVVAAFLFGYVATAYAFTEQAVSKRILAGLAAALVVLIAEGYFLIRYLSLAEEPASSPARPAAPPLDMAPGTDKKRD